MISDQENREHRIAIPTYSLGEELISAISHGVGGLLGVAGLVLCVVKSAAQGDAWKIVSSCVFGFTIILLYVMSCLYHALKVNRAKRVFRVMDHCTIFLLIAGTYTPYTLVAIRPVNSLLAWVIFGVIWGVTVLGITLNAVSLRRFAKISVACYLLMGWMVVLAYGPMTEAIPAPGMRLLIWGGVVYTIGAILYGIGSRKKYFHSIFHFFVLAGTVLHFLSIYLYVL
ncbi:MAG: hemolysin III family protein [Clostridia bacterium]|nr:hemolysin III family protein [Clostridia bacterium]